MAGVAGRAFAHASCVVISCVVAVVFAMNWCDGLYTVVSVIIIVVVVVVARFSADRSGVRLVGCIAVVEAIDGIATVTVVHVSS